MVSSTSTPDLASTNIMSAMNSSHSGVLLGGSSPDLVSRKNLGRVATNKENLTTLHKTMDNLHNFIEPTQIHGDDETKMDQVGGFSKQVSTSCSHVV